MKSAVGRKSKVKASGGAINEKVLVSMSERFVKNCIHEIDTNIFPGFKSEGKFDKRFKETNFEVVMERIFDENDDELSAPDTPDEFTKDNEWRIPDGTNKICEFIVNYCRKQYKVPPQSKLSIYIGKYMRLPPTNIDPPTPDTLNRIIFNFNNDDLYRLEPGPMNYDIINMLNKNESSTNSSTNESDIAKKMNQSLEERTIFLEAGKNFPLGPYRQSNYYIKLNRGKEIRIPPKIQSKMSIKGQNSKFKLKPTFYSRITVVVDIKVSTDMVEKITMETIKKMEENKDMVDDMTKKIKSSDISVGDLMKDANNIGSGNKRKRKRRRRKNKNNEDNEGGNEGENDEELNKMANDNKKDKKYEVNDNDDEELDEMIKNTD